MGQEASAEAHPASPEQLSHELALRFADKCYTQLELYCFKHTFQALADNSSGLTYWTESSLVRFLEIPDHQICAGPVLFQMVSFLGAFPFASQAPAILTIEALLKVITLMTDRYQKVLKRGSQDRFRLLYSSIAVFDRKLSQDIREQYEQDAAADREESKTHGLEETLQDVSGFPKDSNPSVERGAPSSAVPGHQNDHGRYEDYDEDDYDDQMTLDALESLDAIEAIGFSERPNIQHSIIPTDNLLQLVELLLFIAPLRAQESLAEYSAQLSAENVDLLRATATSIISAFCVEAQPGVIYRAFSPVVECSLPYMFDSLGPLFEHFLFEKDFDLSKRKDQHRISIQSTPSSPPLSPSSEQSPMSPRSPMSHSARKSKSSFAPSIAQGPILESPGDILNQVTLTQLACFIPASQLFHRMNLLYSGDKHGFSLGAFEGAVFGWKAPTVLLVTGEILGLDPSDSRERAFFDSLPPKRYPSAVEISSKEQSEESLQGRTVTYGCYVPQAWRQTHKQPFSDSGTILFQLQPVHDVFRASDLNQDYVSFSSGPSMGGAHHHGLNFGSPLTGAGSNSAASAGPLSPGLSSSHVPLGPVSLYIDEALEFGVFTHTAAGGGAFHPSASPLRNGTAKYHQRRRAASSATSSSAATAHQRSQSKTSISTPAVVPSPSPAALQRRLTLNTTASAKPGDHQNRFSITKLEVWGVGGAAESRDKQRREQDSERERKLRRESIAGVAGADAETEILRMAGILGGHGAYASRGD